MSCALTTSSLGTLVTLMLCVRYICYLNLTTVQKLLWAILFIAIGCIPLLVSYRLEPILGKIFAPYRYSLYFVFIGCIILFCLTVARDGVWTLGYILRKYTQYGFSVSPLDSSWLSKLNLITLGISICITAIAAYSGTKTPRLKFVTLSSNKIQQPQTIAVLTDLHLERISSTTKIQSIVERVDQQQPDLILLVGDILDDTVDRISDTTKLLQQLQAKYGVYFVSGNHEFYVGYPDSILALQNLGFKFLENTGVAINSQLYLAGIPDLFSARKHGIAIDLAAAFQGSRDSQYRILMSHTPANFARYANFDLAISGHTHGGQIFPFHIITALSNKYLAGLYRLSEQMQLYVSRGTGQWGPQMRFLAPSEITIIKLLPTI